MNNKIGRKITSLTLMTIMIAGGMTFAIPGVMPAAHAANANLFISAENSQFDNYMSGPQVIEVVIIDSDINDTDEAKGEPDVKVNGAQLRMVQAVDGNWYGYFADVVQAQIADRSANLAAGSIPGEGLDFGTFCNRDTEILTGPSGGSQTNQVVSVTQTLGIAIDSLDGTEGTIPIDATTKEFGFSDCAIGSTAPADPTTMNMIREEKDDNTNSPSGTNEGQIGINGDFWPFIQLYAFSVGGSVNIQYNKGGGAQTTTLTFDTVEAFAGLELDRSLYPRSSEVHVTITDLWMNMDPTDEDSWTFGTTDTGTSGAVSTNYQVFDENGLPAGDSPENTDSDLTDFLPLLMCEDNCRLLMNTEVQNKGDVVTLQDNQNSEIRSSGNAQDPATFATLAGNLAGDVPVTFTEIGPQSGTFGTYSEDDVSNIVITEEAARGTSASIDYNETPVSIVVGFAFASISLIPVDDEWNSGEELVVQLVDNDANQNSRADEDLDLFNVDVDLIPALSTGDPFTLAEDRTIDGIELPAFFAIITTSGDVSTIGAGTDANLIVQAFSKRAITNTTSVTANALIIDNLVDGANLHDTVFKATLDQTDEDRFGDFTGTYETVFNLFNLDVRSLAQINTVSVYLLNGTDGIVAPDGVSIAPGVDSVLIVEDVTGQNYDLVADGFAGDVLDQLIAIPDDSDIGYLIEFTARNVTQDAFAMDFFSYGFTDDGVQAKERVSNQIIRFELEETGDNTSTFEGTLEFVMVNQLNIMDPNTFTSRFTIDNFPTFVVIEDLTDEDSPRISYLDKGADGVDTQVSDQREAPSHSGIVSFDADSYKTADTVTVTIEDLDLNADSFLIDIYTVVEDDADIAFDTVGAANEPILSFGALGRLADITFDDEQWRQGDCGASGDDGLGSTGFTLIETSKDSGIFLADYQVPANWCRDGLDSPVTATGLDMEVNYNDFRDASGEIIEVGDSAGIRANTGSVSLDRTVYPVPFGVPADFGDKLDGATDPEGTSVFPIHEEGLSTEDGERGLIEPGSFIDRGDLTIHVRVNDPDFDISATGEDQIKENVAGTILGPVKISILRGSDALILGYAGGNATVAGKIHVGDTISEALQSNVTQFGPIFEIAPDAGIFEVDIVIRYTDGPAKTTCPDTVDYDNTKDGIQEVTDRFMRSLPILIGPAEDFCILQGDIIQVEYTDPADASGNPNTVTDSATFDLRNGVLQSDKSVYIIGSDMILTLIEPDFDLDNDGAETYDLDLIEWDSDASTVTMGNKGGNLAAFDPEPTAFRETGDSTGIFQIVIEIPEELDNDRLERGEEIILEYTDWGPSGSDFVGDEDEDINLTIYTSNFGATVELDQKVYTWTDKVYITIVAPDHNFDGHLVDEIGATNVDPVKVASRGDNLKNYKLVETGTDTGIFTGEVILTGFRHDADGDTRTGDLAGNDVFDRPPTGNGPTDGKLPTSDDDGLTVSFEFSEDETVVGSSLIRWNIGEVQWLEASYPASGTGVVRIIDPDMNWNPEAVNNFNADIWSDSDAGGIDLTVTETNEATGIFEGTVFFTTTDESSGHRLRVAEGDTVTAEYEDNTLPDPYTTADELDITATSLIGTVVPPLERAPASNCRVADAFGNTLSSVSVDQQVQITCDVANGQDREQPFAYLIQVQNSDGVTVSLAWITGSLSPGQSFSPALSWIPDGAGAYDATVFVWESVDNPTALSPPQELGITVN